MILHEQPDMMDLYTRQQYISDNQTLKNDLEQLKTKYHHLNIFEVIDQFCPTKNCLFKNEQGQPYYFDSNHITLTGTALMRPIFEEIFQK